MAGMTRRERVQRAMHFKTVDKAPVRYYYCPVGYYEHGDKLNDLYATLPGDFEPFRRMPIVGPAKEEYDADGRYHAFKTDEWGVKWEYRIFGVAGIPLRHPITTPEEAEVYHTPPHVLCEGAEFDAFIKEVEVQKAQDYPVMLNGGKLYEQMIALYGDENVLCDMAMEEAGINKLADRITEYNEALIRRAVKAGADAICFGDDYGTERSLLMSPEMWRAFFKPRLKRMFREAVDSGLDIHFHSCGQVWEILPDLKEIGVTSIWPQLPAYNMQALADRCRELQLAVEIHTDRANTMTYGTPQQVRDLVRREFDTFKMMDGGSWFYVEADNDFPFANLEALVNTIAEYR